MSKIETGGAAFPESYIGADAPHEGIGGGMTLRQWYAGSMMAAMVGDIERWDCNPQGVSIEEYLASKAFSFSDALIAAQKATHHE